MAKEKTKREMFNEILTVVADNEEMADFIKHEIELLDNRKSSPKKPTQNQIENEKLKEAVLATLTELDKPVCIKDLCEACPSLKGLSNQKVTRAILTPLVNEEKITRTLIKKVPYFCIAQAE